MHKSEDLDGKVHLTILKYFPFGIESLSTRIIYVKLGLH